MTPPSAHEAPATGATDLTARCLNTLAPCPGVDVICTSPRHKQVVEEAHMARHHNAEPDTDELCEQMVNRHADEAALVAQAIEACARVNNGVVDQNVVRTLLAPLNHPGVIGSVYRVWKKAGRLVVLDTNINDDKRSRNVGKPQPRYRLVDSRQLADDRSVTA